MANYKVKGKTQRIDVRRERIAAGTIGAEQIVGRSVGANLLNSIIDSADERISYSNDTSVNTGRLGTFDYRGTFSVLANEGDTASLDFYGTSIGVLTRWNRYSGGFRVYIDGVETRGRIGVWGIPDETVYSSTTPISADATEIYGIDLGSFAASDGYIQIDDEIIHYTTKTLITGRRYLLSGCTRAQDGSVAAEHNYTSTIYYWTSAVPVTYGATNEWAARALSWYNPYLSNGPHTITIEAITSSSSGYAAVYLDGFVVGSLIGSGQVNHFLNSFTITGTTDGSGTLNVGVLEARREVALIGVFGVDQISPDSVAGSTQGKLNWSIRYGLGNGMPYLSIVNAPASTAISFQVIFVYLGEAI